MGKNREFAAANQRGRQFQAAGPRAVGAHYDRIHRRIVIQLEPNLELSFPATEAQGLDKAKPSQLDRIEISPSGFGLHFPKLDADLWVPALLEGILGSRKWMAARLGQAGGKSRSRAKRTASKANGKLGGRPKKEPAAMRSARGGSRSFSR
jgi:Protein of unknown function (DUF2442)